MHPNKMRGVSQGWYIWASSDQKNAIHNQAGNISSLSKGYNCHSRKSLCKDADRLIQSTVKTQFVGNGLVYIRSLIILIHEYVAMQDGNTPIDTAELEGL